MFYIFILACRRYKFTYTLNTVGELTIILHPYNTFGIIEVKQEYYEHNYFKLFLKAIKKMRAYRKGSEGH